LAVTCKSPCSYSGRGWASHSAGVCGFCGFEPKGLHEPPLFCATPPAFDELFVD
jgi:hypothetical protein